MKRKVSVPTILIVILIGLYYGYQNLVQLTNLPIPEPTVESAMTQEVVTSGGIPLVLTKQEPVEITYQGCPPGGDGGDTIQNQLKNRVDTAESYYPVDFQSVLALTWPKSVERTDRDTWTTEEANAISKYEGIPVSVEGYLTAATQSGPESTNCHGTDADMSDWHVTLVQNPGEDRSFGLVTETTPRVRKDHSWTLATLKDIIANGQKVRISGWLFFDPEHPDHIGKYRATLWEIHPITKIEVFSDNQWITLP